MPNCRLLAHSFKNSVEVSRFLLRRSCSSQCATCAARGWSSDSCQYPDRCSSLKSSWCGSATRSNIMPHLGYLRRVDGPEMQQGRNDEWQPVWNQAARKDVFRWLVGFQRDVLSSPEVRLHE